MKKLPIILFFLVTISSIAQDKVLVQLDKIDELKVYNGLNVNLIKSDEQKLEILGDRASEVSIKNKRGVLKISLDLLNTFKHQVIKINLYYNSNIGKLSANQGSLISSKEVFKQLQLSVHSQEGSYIKLNLDVDYLKVRGITGGNIQFKGISKTQNVSIVSGSNYEAFDLKSNEATIYASTGSDAKVNVSKALDAKAKLGGTIVFSGRPEAVSTEESLGGKINKLQLEKEITAK